MDNLKFAAQSLKAYHGVKTLWIEADFSHHVVERVNDVIEKTKELDVSVLVNNVGMNADRSILDE